MTLERILAATAAINMMAVDLQRLATEKMFMGKPVSQTVDDQTTLVKTANALKEVVEDLGNYIDGHDAQNDETLTALNALLDIVYER